MADEKLIAKIEDWLRGEMPPDEATVFKAQMDADTSLAEEVELHRLTLRAMQQLSEQDLQGKVLNWLGEGPSLSLPVNEPTKPPGIFPKWPWVALALLLLFIAGAFGIKAWGTFNDEERQKEVDALKEQLRSLQLKVNEQASLPASEPSKLDSIQKEYAKLLEKATKLENQLNAIPKNEATKSKPIAKLDDYYSLPTWTGGVRSEINTGNTQAVLTEAVAAFNDSDFQKSAAKAQQVIDAEPSNSAAIRLMAHALFNESRYFEAIEAFNKLKTIVLYEDEADWNLMLCHWRLSKIDAGQRLDFEQAVKQLAKSQNPKYAAKAKELMKAEKVK
jgi:tetratricopeptide (TPR) repeat protein